MTKAQADPGDSLAALPPGIVQRDASLHFDTSLPAAALWAAVDQVYRSHALLSGLDYPVLLKVLYGVGPALPRAATATDKPLVRFAREVLRFAPQRRSLYKNFKLDDTASEAEYYFEPVFVDDTSADGAALAPARLDVDEFVAALWCRGLRFGIDVAAVQGAIAGGRAERLIVARRFEPIPSRDADIVEVTQQLQRSDAPRQRADGRLDLLDFKNRFPQVKQHARLLRKRPASAGCAGIALDGSALPVAAPADVDLAALAGPGTAIEQLRDGDYLVATEDGFLAFDSASQRMSVSAVIVSHEGVSSRTTGNLHLSRAYEEYGEVQELRSVEGADITIHGDVFGKIVSRGGVIDLKRNLVGGSAFNTRGDISVAGVASGAVLQTRDGTLRLARAENSLLTGSRIHIGEALNCDIVGDEVTIGQAEGCAIAARRITLDSAAPRKQNEMLLFALAPELAGFDQRVAVLGEKGLAFAGHAAARQDQIDALSSRADVRTYIALANKVRKQEVQLSAEQLPQFQKMALAVGPALKAIGKLSLEVKAARAQHQAMVEQAAQVIQDRAALAAQTWCRVARVDGDTVLRTLALDPDGAAPHDRGVKEIRALLHGAAPGAPVLVADSGALAWRLGEEDQGIDAEPPPQ